jgi:predicted Zn-dependent protease
MRLWPLIVMLLLAACGDFIGFRKSSSKKQDVSALYQSRKIVIQVWYEPGAEPYAGGSGGLHYWDLLQKNLEALFQGHPQAPQIVVPKELGQMHTLPLQNRPQWSTDQVYHLGQGLESAAEAATSVFHLLFLNGRSSEGDNVIGFHISDTRIIAIFKDVVRQTAGDHGPLASAYTEQATLVHEMGHALGLVNNGIPMTHPHQDKANSAHCSDEECVMYYAHEGPSGLVAFARRAMARLSPIMFDQHCLNDVRNYKD